MFFGDETQRQTDRESFRKGFFQMMGENTASFLLFPLLGAIAGLCFGVYGMIAEGYPPSAIVLGLAIGAGAGFAFRIWDALS